MNEGRKEDRGRCTKELRKIKEGTKEGEGRNKGR
jgi:hypothetical protein